MLAAAAAIVPTKAWAYPTAVIFSPSGKSLPANNISGYVYGGLPLSGADVELNPWAGIQAGLGPTPDAPPKGPSFGGAELGMDVLGVGDGRYKLVLNAKIQLLAAWGALGPDVAIGMMQLSVSDVSRSMSFAYLAVSRSFKIRDTDVGTFAVGWGHSFAPSPPDGESRAFTGTFPFRRAAREALLLGYVTPALGPLSLAIDHFGGNSEASDLYAGLNIAPTQWLLVTPGAFFALERANGAAVDGAFLNVAVTIDAAPRPPTATRAAP
ncbi:MAG: hypothetical protein HY898_25360 [Deltaproteobacteria bacterium]|nr:hypothetical protein [Deltaproteobacteria bacterium]